MKTFREVSKAMNFQYTVHEPKTGIRFPGVISDLVQNQADFAVSHLFLTYDRIVQLGMDFSSPINTDHYSFLV